MIEKSPSPRARRLMRAGAVVGGVLALFVAVAGFLHTPAGRPLLSKLAGKGCPFGRGKLEPARREELRRFALSKLAQTYLRSPAHSSLGFELGSAKRVDVEAWAAGHRLTCKPESKGSGLACGAVPGALL